MATSAALNPMRSENSQLNGHNPKVSSVALAGSLTVYSANTLVDGNGFPGPGLCHRRTIYYGAFLVLVMILKGKSLHVVVGQACLTL